jgi:hypothetical protein
MVQIINKKILVVVMLVQVSEPWMSGLRATETLANRMRCTSIKCWNILEGSVSKNVHD